MDYLCITTPLVGYTSALDACVNRSVVSFKYSVSGTPKEREKVHPLLLHWVKTLLHFILLLLLLLLLLLTNTHAFLL